MWIQYPTEAGTYWCTHQDFFRPIAVSVFEQSGELWWHDTVRCEGPISSHHGWWYLKIEPPETFNSFEQSNQD